jgi:hypothetical protein
VIARQRAEGNTPGLSYFQAAREPGEGRVIEFRRHTPESTSEKTAPARAQALA